MKYYQVMKETFVWTKGAIIAFDETLGKHGGYRAIDEIWNVVDNTREHISKKVIEAEENKETFQRVYEVSGLGKLIYVTKEKARELAGKFFKEPKE